MRWIGAHQKSLQLLLAITALFIGLSAASAVRGPFQIIFWLIVLIAVAANFRTHRAPVNILLGFIWCGAVSAAAHLYYGTSLVSSAQLLRPLVEGYLLGAFLYLVCGIRNFKVLVAVLAGYVIAEFISALLMLSFPGLRELLIERVYGQYIHANNAAYIPLINAIACRGYGFSMHHLFAFALAIGSICALLLEAASQEQLIRRQVLLGLVAFGGMLLVLPNARMGLVPIIIAYLAGIAISSHASLAKYYYLKHLLLTLIIGIPLVTLTTSTAFKQITGCVSEQLIYAVTQFTARNDSGDNTISGLFRTTAKPASSNNWLFGDGQAKHPGENGYSDSGLIYLLQEGGLLLLLSVVALYLAILFKISRGLVDFSALGDQAGSAAIRFLPVFAVMLVTFIAAIIKGYAFMANDYSRLLVALAVFVGQIPQCLQSGRFRSRDVLSS